MDIVTITRNLDEITVNLLAQIAEYDAGEDRYPNESATLRRIIREEASRLNLTSPAPQKSESPVSRRKS